MHRIIKIMLGAVICSLSIGSWANKNDAAALSGEEIVLAENTSASKGADPALSRLRIDHRNLKRYKARK